MNLNDKLKAQGFGIIDVFGVGVILVKDKKRLEYSKARGIEKMEGTWSEEELKLVDELDNKKGDIWSE